MALTVYVVMRVDDPARDNYTGESDCEVFTSEDDATAQCAAWDVEYPHAATQVLRRTVREWP